MNEGRSQPNHAKVSVVIPTFNSSATLPSCLNSVYAQSCPVHEVIVADNFSTDSTAEVAKRLGATVLTQSGKVGNAASSKNRGFLKASGDYILFLDSDEVLESKVAEECLALCENEGVGMVKIPLVFIGKGFWSSSSAFWRNCHYIISIRTTGNFPRFFKKKHLCPVPYKDELAWGEDWELYIRMKALGVGEAYCKSHMIHLEPPSLAEMVLKHILYARAIPKFPRNVNNKVYYGLVKNAYLAFREAVMNPPNPPHLLAGCLLFLCFKALAMMIGLCNFGQFRG